MNETVCVEWRREETDCVVRRRLETEVWIREKTEDVERREKIEQREHVVSIGYFSDTYRAAHSCITCVWIFLLKQKKNLIIEYFSDTYPHGLN
jgi:hypothetical protein